MKPFISFICLLTLLIFGRLYAQNGILDLDFDADGKVFTDIGPNNDVANAIAVQGDGKILIAGTTMSTTDKDCFVIRYLPDGTIDQTFANNGYDTLDFSNYYDYVASIMIQTDGKIIVAGRSANISSFTHYFLARYNSDGTLDPSFGMNGRVFDQINGSNAFAGSYTLASDGKIYGGGAYLQDFIVFRLLSDGSLDTTFGTNGYVITDTGPDEAVYDIIEQPDGKILAAGPSGSASTKYSFALARYLSNGIPDSTFSYDGHLLTSIGTVDDWCNGMCLDNEGNIYLNGSTSDGSTESFVIVKYQSDGSIDLNFNQSGKCIIPIQTTAISIGSAIQIDGKILLSGISMNAGNQDFAMVRIKPDGIIDSTFGTNGIVLTDMGSTADYAGCMAIQPSNGRILLAGKSNPVSSDEVAIARFIADINFGMVTFENAMNHILIYPNPVKTNCLLSYELVQNENISIELFDALGKKVKTFFSCEERNKGLHYEELYFEDITTPGNYLLNVTNGINQVNVKIVKE